MRSILFIALMAVVFTMVDFQGDTASAAEQNQVEVTKANFYVAWGMITVQNIEIANNSGMSIKNPEVEFIYNNSYDRDKRVAKLTLPLEIPANSKAVYLKNGIHRLLVNTGGNAGMHTGKSFMHILNKSNSEKVVKIVIKSSFSDS